MDNYLEILKEANQPLMEMVPWRSGKIPLQYGKTQMKGLTQDCLILNNLKFIMRFNPSLMLIIPKISELQRIGGGVNGWLVTARKAQQLEFKEVESGSCTAYTYFFGRSKKGRTFDLIQRIFEKGFSLENISGLKVFPDNATIEFTTKSSDYSKSSFFTGSTVTSITGDKNKNASKEEKMLIPVRIKRTK